MPPERILQNNRRRQAGAITAGNTARPSNYWDNQPGRGYTPAAYNRRSQRASDYRPSNYWDNQPGRGYNSAAYNQPSWDDLTNRFPYAGGGAGGGSRSYVAQDAYRSAQDVHRFGGLDRQLGAGQRGLDTARFGQTGQAGLNQSALDTARFGQTGQAGLHQRGLDTARFGQTGQAGLHQRGLDTARFGQTGQAGLNQRGLDTARFGLTGQAGLHQRGLDTAREGFGARSSQALSQLQARQGQRLGGLDIQNRQLEDSIARRDTARDQAVERGFSDLMASTFGAGRGSRRRSQGRFETDAAAAASADAAQAGFARQQLSHQRQSINLEGQQGRQQLALDSQLAGREFGDQQAGQDFNNTFASRRLGDQQAGQDFNNTFASRRLGDQQAGQDFNNTLASRRLGDQQAGQDFNNTFASRRLGDQQAGQDFNNTLASRRLGDQQAGLNEFGSDIESQQALIPLRDKAQAEARKPSSSGYRPPETDYSKYIYEALGS